MARTIEEEQEAVIGAVINVLHSLAEMANDKEIEAHLRVLAASEVLTYATACNAPVSESEEPGEPEVDIDLTFMVREEGEEPDVSSDQS